MATVNFALILYHYFFILDCLSQVLVNSSITSQNNLHCCNSRFALTKNSTNILHNNLFILIKNHQESHIFKKNHNCSQSLGLILTFNNIYAYYLMPLQWQYNDI